MRPLLLAIALLIAPPVHADEESDARQLYSQGKEAYEAGRFQEAYESFERAYLKLQRPQLLFNMASALQKLDRPHDAAERLRGYLRVVPTAPERPQLEEQIRMLEEKQRILDEKNPKPVAGVLLESPPAAPPPRKSRRGLVIGLSIAGAVVAATAVGLAVGLTVGGGAESLSTGTIGSHAGTF